MFNSSLKDTESIKSTGPELEKHLLAVEKFGLLGKFKAWIYQQTVLPWILWPLLVYNVPLSTVEGFEWKISQIPVESITMTALQPDIVLLLGTSIQVVMLELTVPWEDRMEEAAERKHARYADLVEDCCKQRWRTWCLPIEVGCRGFAGRSLCKAFHLLGITGVQKKQAIKHSTEAAERALR